MDTNTIRTLPPTHFEGHLQTEHYKQWVIKVLREGDAEDKRLASKIRVCKKENRCLSGACPSCLREARIWLMSHGVTAMEDLAIAGRRGKIEGASKDWSVASIIPAGFNAPLGALHTLSLKTKVKTTARCLQRANLNGARVIGGIDLSLNTLENEEHTWQLQLFLLINAPPSDGLKETLAEAFSPEPMAKRPLHVSSMYMPRTALSYAFKSTFQLRSAYDSDGEACVRKVRLSKKEYVRELSRFLAQGKPLQRLILRGIKREGENLKVL